MAIMPSADPVAQSQRIDLERPFLPVQSSATSRKPTPDPLYASALVLEAGGRRLAIVGLDLGRGPTESMLSRLRERIRTEAGIDHAFFGGSHTHHGPVLELSDAEGKGRGKFGAALRYYEELEDELVAVVTEASRNLVPAQLAVGSRELEGFNRNRHTRIEPKPVDRELRG
jgi:neutral ceramidase